ncbi:MAG: tetratricopeptide repeat protein [Gemmatimonadota bacterium]
MTLDKLKVAARQHEQREEWRAAIELYRQAIREGEGGNEGADPSLYNRIGDLEHKAGDDSAACDAWDQAAARYGEQGFFNNAIALCGKILRLDADRIRTHLDLARYQARKRVLYDVKAQLTTYLERMDSVGRGDGARTAVEAFADEFSSWRDLQRLVDELLGRVGELETPTEPATAGTEGPSGLIFIDTDLRLERASEGSPDFTVPAPIDSLVEEPTGILTVDPSESLVDEPIAFEAPTDGIVLEGLETSVQEFDGTPPPASEIVLDGLVDHSRTLAEAGDQAPLAGLEQTALDAPQETGAPLVFLETESVAAPDAPPPGPPALPELPEGITLDDPLGQRVTAHALLEHGDRAGGIARLETALAGYQERNEWLHAYQVASELVQAEPSVIGRYQARVEVASQMKDTARLCESYAELGDAFVREGSSDKAVAVYRRILELDEHHARARAALRAMMPDTPPEETAEGFIDFAAMMNEDAGPRSTRMRTETTAISADEDETFREALAEFKRALDQNLPIEDHQAHYDLGIAFKEMGLLDEAIGEFQKALRSPEGRLRTSEALGQAFFDQGRPAVSEAVLRAVERGPEGDAEKIGVLYWLGRAQEAQGKMAEARGCYERVLAVDVGFHDVADRLTQLTSDNS